jgi:hypothetical protein
MIRIAFSVALACWSAAPSWGATVQNFDVPNTGSPYVASLYLNPPAATPIDGGPIGTGKFLRLASGAPTPAPSHNTIAFDRTDSGASEQIVVDFDFRMIPGNAVIPGKGRADGFGFALLNTGFYGSSGGLGGNAEEPNFTASLGVGFDLYKNDNLGDIGNENITANFSNSISIHFNGVPLTQVDATPVVDMGGGQWIHARIIVRPGGGFSDVSVILTPPGGAPVTLVDRFPVAGLTPYEGRIHFGARCGGESAHHDLDNINAQFIGLAQSVLSFSSLSFAAEETGVQAGLTVRRTGNTSGTVSVQYSTANLTATAGADYAATAGVLTFGPGEISKTFTVPIFDDPNSEGDEAFMATLSSPTGGAVVGGPSSAQVAIVDDESSRTVGHWGGIIPWPIVAVHLHMLPTGKVMFWDRLSAASLWDPSTQAFSSPSLPGYDAFCSGHTLLSDGRLLVTGGHADAEGSPQHDGEGIPNASIYEPFGNVWTPLPNMNAGRWYPTNTTLANGETLVLSGSIDTAYTKNALPQVLQLSSSSWRNLTNAEQQQLASPVPKPLGVDLYPRMFVAPDGRVFKSGPDKDTWFLDTAGTGNWLRGPDASFGLRTYGTAVMYAPGKILIAGGGDVNNGNTPNDDATNAVEVIDLNAATPAWRNVPSMALARRQLDSTVLPDGKVLITGGTGIAGFNNEANPVLPSEMFDPVTETWATVAAMQVPRGYHSTALLLPDGRVLSAGGGEGAGATSLHNDAELYSPPYLFKGPRPTITSAPTAVTYGQVFAVKTPNAAAIAKVSLIRLPSVTHSFDENARFITASFAPSSDGINVTAPSSGNVCPPGHYMLFILNANGVPSVARILHVSNNPFPSGRSDFNQDGKPDLVWRHDGGAICVWFMDGINLLSGAFFNPNLVDPSWKISGVGDFNQDGKPDLVWRQDSGTIGVWHMNGINLVAGALFNPSQTDPSWKISGVGDFNLDGKPDLVWRHDSGAICVWFMDGINLLSSAFFNPGQTDPSWKISGVGDFNLDGKPDLVWRHTSGAICVWFMNGINILSSSFFNPSATDPSWKISGVGDFNRDGKPDLVWRHDSGALYAWFMDGINFLSGSFFSPAQVDPSWKNSSP